MDIKELISKSIDWRTDKFNQTQTNAFRLFAGLSDGIEGLFVDRYSERKVVEK